VQDNAVPTNYLSRFNTRFAMPAVIAASDWPPLVAGSDP
jgi:hypothetical protein